MIILCPTRGRPKEFERMVKSAFNTAEGELQIWCYISQDDATLDEYKHLFDDKKIIPVSGPDYSCVMAINEMGKMSAPEKSDLIMLGADDTIFRTKGWDIAIKKHYDDLPNKIHVYSMQDSRSTDGTPHLIMTREYIDAMGYTFPPIFLHWFADSWTADIAKSNECFTHMKDYLLEHDKPSDKGIYDETFTRIRKLGWHNRDAYVNESCRHFLQFEKQRLKIIIEKSI